jgi:hypothetical protein
MGIVYIDKCRYEIPEYKEVPVRELAYTGPFRALILLYSTAGFLEYVSFLVSE